MIQQKKENNRQRLLDVSRTYSEISLSTAKEKENKKKKKEGQYHYNFSTKDK